MFYSLLVDDKKFFLNMHLECLGQVLQNSEKMLSDVASITSSLLMGTLHYFFLIFTSFVMTKRLKNDILCVTQRSTAVGTFRNLMIILSIAMISPIL